MVARLQPYVVKVAKLLFYTCGTLLALTGAEAIYRGLMPSRVDGFLWLGLLCFILPFVPSLRDVGDGFVREDDGASEGS